MEVFNCCNSLPKNTYSQISSEFLLYFFNTASELLSNIVSVFFEVATNSQNWLPRAKSPRSQISPATQVAGRKEFIRGKLKKLGKSNSTK